MVSDWMGPFGAVMMPPVSGSTEANEPFNSAACRMAPGTNVVSDRGSTEGGSRNIGRVSGEDLRLVLMPPLLH
jgi:hypothetical protein